MPLNVLDRQVVQDPSTANPALDDVGTAQCHSLLPYPEGPAPLTGKDLNKRNLIQLCTIKSEYEY